MVRASRPPQHLPPLKVLVVPADVDQAPRVIDLNDGDGTVANLQREVGRLLEVQAHPEADFWLHDEGRLIDLPINVRVNHWLLHDSTRAREGVVTEGWIIYGDAVVTGPADATGDTTPVDDTMIDYFENLRLDANALADWDIRTTEATIIPFDLGDWPPPDIDPGL